MIAPKPPKLTKADERRAYQTATERDSGRCVFMAWDCQGAVQRDHRKNRSQGGATSPENLQLLCGKHHQWKTEHPDDAAREGYAVPGWADPAKWPARRYEPTAHGTMRPIWVLYKARGWTEITKEDAFLRITLGRLYEEAS